MTSAELAAIWGRKIRRLRIDHYEDAEGIEAKREWTVTAVAERLDISKRHLHNIEAGRSLPGDALRPEIANVLGVKPDDIFSYDLQEVSQP